jgi:SAM-dependent methyltransferase
VSVIVPTYDVGRSPRLGSALASIWAQEGIGKVFDLEPIVVDDGCVGPIEEVIESFPATRYVRSATNLGQAAARNAGLREATGDYIAFLDDDDLWLPHKLRIQVPALARATTAEVVYSRFVDDRPDGTLRVVPPGIGPSGWIFAPLFKQTILMLHSILSSRAVFEKVGGFDESLSGPEDRDMWSRLALEFPFRFVPGVVSVYQRSTIFGLSRPDDMIRWLRTCRDKILPLVDGRSDEDEIKGLIVPGTEAHVAWILFRSGRPEAAKRALFGALAEYPIDQAEPWCVSMLRRLTTELAKSSGSIDEVTALCAALQRTDGRVEERRVIRSFVADAWSSVASRSSQGSKAAMAAAANAISNDPRKALSPGLVKGLARALVPRPAKSVAKRLMTGSPVRARKVERVRWGNTRRITPFSKVWGYDRGEPIDRFYIHDFLQRHAPDIAGDVLEVQDPSYTRMFGGSRVTTSHILDIDPRNPAATLVADLSDPDSLPEGKFDCFVMTQTLHLVPDAEMALRNAWRSLAPGGTLLISVAAIAKLDPQYRDAAQWRFTPNALERLLRRTCPGPIIEVRGYGNVLTAIASLMGLAAEDMNADELEFNDPDFPLVTCARVKKAVAS